MCIICDRVLLLQCTNSLRENTANTRFIITFSEELTELTISLPKVRDEIKLVSVVLEKAAQEAVKSIEKLLQYQNHIHY